MTELRMAARASRSTATFVLSALLLVGSLALVVAGPVAAAAPSGEVTIAATGIGGPDGVVLGPDANVWFTSAQSAAIGRITPAGVVTMFRGPGVNRPKAITVGPDANLWFTNIGNNSIGRITPAGAITNYTGTGIGSPFGIAAGADGNLWFANAGNDSIGRITPIGVVSSFTSSDVNQPRGITAGSDGNLWFVNAGGSGSIGRITTTGAITTFTGFGASGSEAIAAGPDGNLWFTSSGATPGVGRITPAGVITHFTTRGLSVPRGISQGPDGNLWFTDAGVDRVGRITTDGAITLFTDPSIHWPIGITTGADGSLWFANNTSNTIGRIAPAGVVTSFAGNRISGPRGIVTGPDGNLWFTNTRNNTIGRVSTAGVVEDYVGAGISNPYGITAGADNNLWFTNADNNTIGRVTTAGAVTNYSSAGISGPHGITAGPDGNLWFTNSTNNSIGRTTPTGMVTNFTGTEISAPEGIVAGPDGNLWFTNRNSSAIGRITPAGVVTAFYDPGVLYPTAITRGPDGNLWFTSPGNWAVGRITTGGLITMFRGDGVNGPTDIVAGADGNLWFTNLNFGSVGRITTSGVIAKITDPALNEPQGITAGPDGNLWFTNFNGDAVGFIGTTPAAPSPPVGVVGFAGNEQVRVAWSPPPSDGGSPVTGYTATAMPGGATCATVGSLFCSVTGLTGGIAYTFRVTATSVLGTSLPSVASAAVTPKTTPGDAFQLSGPKRILDSRGPIGGWGAPLSAGTPRTLSVTGGATGVPASATAVVLNVTVTNATANSFLTVHAAGAPTPLTSNLNFAAGQTIPNLVTVAVGAGGQVEIANATGSTDVVADVAGWFVPGPGKRYTATTPTRLLDSRGSTGGWNGKLAAGTARTLPVTSIAGIPSTAAAVIMNVTVTGATADSYLVVHPTGAAPPTASNLNFATGQTTANLVVAKVGDGGQVSFTNSAGATDVIADVVGYFDAASGDRFHVVTPVRSLDSRDATGNWGAPLVAGSPRTLSLQGTTLPAEATAVMANATVTDGTANSFLTVYPPDSSVPNASNINFGVGQTIASMVAVKLGTNGTVGFANASGSTNLIFDVVGYFAPT